jgi:hypothetical protein
MTAGDIMKFELIADTNSTKFTEKINSLLSDGWNLHGPTFTRSGFYEERDSADGSQVQVNHRPLFCQALTK